MKNSYRPRLATTLAAALLAALTLTGPAQAMLGGTDHSKPPDGIAEAWNLPPDQRQSWSKAYGVDVTEKNSTIPQDVLHPGDRATFTLHLTNDTDQPIAADGRLEVIRYQLKTKETDFFSYEIGSLGIASTLPVPVNVPAHGTQDVEVTPDIPALFGGYALVLDLGKSGRHLAALCIRTFPPVTRTEEFPVFTLDQLDPAMLDLLGIHSIRIGLDYKSTTDVDFAEWLDDYGKKIAKFQQHHVTLMIVTGGGSHQILGQWAHMLDDKDQMTGGFNDTMFPPSDDPDFTKFVQAVCGRYGWPKGPITAFCLYNEPWEGGGISGWLADMPRYREAYTAMAQGVLAARKEDGTQVLVGGTDSTSNALDKMFGDGKDTFLPVFDYVSMHYQGLASSADIPMWRDRKGPTGRVRRWDTESWVANTDDRIAPLLASWRAAGYDRLMGVDANCVVEQGHPGSPAAALSAATHFLGDRPFREFLFRNGLPWVMVFDGLPGGDGKADPEDGSVVVTGDILAGATSLYRTVQSVPQRTARAAIRKELDALPSDANPKIRQALQTRIDSVPRAGGTMTLPGSDSYSLYDFYGNPVAPWNGHIVIPLNANGYFLRGDGKPGSFAGLLAALRAARVEGLEPVEFVAHDFTAPLAAHPTLRLSLTNVLNRPVTGTLSARIPSLTLMAPAQSLTLGPNETRDIALPVIAGKDTPGNTYPLTAAFDAGADGRVDHTEDLHCNVIARRTITVDGNLDDWQGVLPQPVSSGGSPPSLTEKAWYPNRTFDTRIKAGFATGYLACDAKNFYFAARVADGTPSEGTLRFANRRTDPHFDDQFFFPDTFYAVQKDGQGNITKRTEMHWPAGVRHYVYRKDPILPSGNGAVGADNIQIAFNVIPEDDVKDKGMYPYPAGTMPHYTPYKDTDYEYALNKVAPRYGSGTEIWRLLVPGMPRKHFYPRQPAAPFDGPAHGGKLVIRRDGGTLLYECSLPWTEIPWVKKRLDAGKTVKFSFRVNDQDGTGYELAHDRSVSATNGAAFHVDWQQHWSNELEFGAAQ